MVQLQDKSCTFNLARAFPRPSLLGVQPSNCNLNATGKTGEGKEHNEAGFDPVVTESQRLCERHLPPCPTKTKAE